MKQRPWKKLLRRSAILTLAVAVGYVLYILLTDNFHTVVPRQLYRSGQMSARSLIRAIQRHGIKTVVNLRGPAGDDWYLAETNATALLRVQHFDLNLSARRELSDAEAATLIATLRSAAKPVLVHCDGGADRSGLASALYLYDSGVPAAVALRQLTVFYGHFPHWKWAKAIAMDRTFARYTSNCLEQAKASLNQP